MALSNVRFIKNNTNTGSATFIAGQTVPSADPLFPASNIFVPDRYVKHVVPGDATTNTYPRMWPIDLGYQQIVDVVGVVGMNRLVTTHPQNISVRSYYTWPDIVQTSCDTTNTSGATIWKRPAGWSTSLRAGMAITGTGVAANTQLVARLSSTTIQVTTAPSSTSSSVTLTFSDGQDAAPPGSHMSGQYQNDLYFIMSSAIIARYWFVTVDDTPDGFSLGSILLGNIVDDLGIAYSPGSSETSVLRRVHNTTANMVTTSATVGTTVKKRISYRFSNVDATTKVTLRGYAEASPVLMLLPGPDVYGTSRELYEMDFADDGFVSETVWGTPEVYNCTLSGESLP